SPRWRGGGAERIRSNGVGGDDGPGSGGRFALPIRPSPRCMADARSRAVIKRQVLSLLRNDGRKAFRPKEIAKALGFKDNKRYRLFRDVLQELDQARLVERVKGGRYQHKKRPQRNLVEGTITTH